MDNTVATAEAAEMAEGAAIVEMGAVKIEAGVAVRKRKVARIPNLAIRPLALTAIYVSNPTKPRNAQTAPPPQRRRPLPTPNMVDFGVVSAQTSELGCSSPQALTRPWPHAAPRASGMKMTTRWQTAVLPKI